MVGRLIGGDSESCPSLLLEHAELSEVCVKGRNGAYSGSACGQKHTVMGRVVWIGEVVWMEREKVAGLGLDRHTSFFGKRYLLSNRYR